MAKPQLVVVATLYACTRATAPLHYLSKCYNTVYTSMIPLVAFLRAAAMNAASDERACWEGGKRECVQN